MKRRLCTFAAGCLLLLALPLAFSGCYKDEVDLPALTTNPFDPDYTGESVFVFDSTYVSVIMIGNPPIPAGVQIVQLHLRADLLPAGATTSVRFQDPEADDPVIVAPVPGTYIYRFQRTVAEPFIERCYSVALWNSFSESRAENICCTLQ